MAVPWLKSFSARLWLFILCAVVVSLVPAAHAEQKQVPAPAKPGVPQEFRVGPGDVLRIDVWRESEVSGDVVVRPDGRISLPLLKEMDVNGMTPIEIQMAVTEKLAKFFASPDVTVIIKSIQSKRVYLVGQVRKVGPLPLLSNLTLAQALSEAGGPTEYANTKRILLLRDEGGKQVRYQFNYKDFLKGQGQQHNIELKPGDTIVVP